MKLYNIVNPKFQDAMNKLSAEPLPLKTAYRLKGIVKKVKEESAKHEELRLDALQRYGRKKEDGSLEVGPTGEVSFEPENLKSFIKELSELNDSDVDFVGISMDDIGANVRLSVEELVLLDGVIV